MAEARANLDRLIQDLLPDAEIEIANHILVDMVVDAIDDDFHEGARVTLAALTIEDW